MGSLFSSPKPVAVSVPQPYYVMPPQPQPVTTPAPSPSSSSTPPASGGGTTSPAPSTSPPATASQAGLLDRTRGILSTVLTGFDGILTQSTTPQGKSLLGE